MLLHGPAVAAAPRDRGLQRGRPQRVPAVQVARGDAAGGVGGGRGQLPVLHPGPAQQQPVPVGDEHRRRSPPARTARPMTLRARTGSPPCSAASVTSAAGRVRRDAGGRCSAVIDWPSRATAAGEGPVEGQQQALGQAAGGARGRGRRARASALIAARAAAASPAATDTMAPAAPTTASRVRTRASGTVRRPARRCRRAWRRWPRCAPRRRARRVVGGQQFVGQRRRRSHSRRSAPARRRGGRSARAPLGGGAVQPRGTAAG